MRRELDFYPTPANVIDTLIAAMPCWDDMSRMRVLDPCCGDGAILDAVGVYGPLSTVGVEIDASRAEAARAKGHDVKTIDALACEWPSAELLLMNPPFGEALAFVEKAARWAEYHRGVSACLVRLSFLSSKGRVSFHQEWPSTVVVIGGRPSFTGDGKTDSVDYAWLLFGSAFGREWMVQPLVSVSESDARRRVAA